jgi:hypothetical protein
MVQADGCGRPTADGRLRASVMHRTNKVSEKGPHPKRSHGLDEAKFSNVATPSVPTRTQVPRVATARGRGEMV